MGHAMKKLARVVFGIAAFLTVAEPVRADVRVAMHDGLVTIVAKDVTIRQILTEWAKVGQTTIVNAERIAGGPVSLELSDVPEKQALDILLRSVNGYLAAPRPTIDPNASRFDRVVVLPTTTQPRSLTASSAPPPQLPQPRFQLPPAPVDINDQANPNLPVDPNQRQPLVNQFAPPPVNQFPPPGVPPADSGRPPAPFTPPSGPVGTSAPGMVLPPPTAPAPGQPPRPLGEPPRF
jgi:hypothetical protein